MTPPTAGPRCPRCHRPLAAWRMGHCIYCGEAIPAELKEGFAEPEGLKWVERPALPTDVSKKLEMMRIVRPEAPRKTRVAWAVAAGVAFPLLIGIFYLAYSLLRRLSPISGALILIVGMGAIGYLVVAFLKTREKAPAGASGTVRPGGSPRP